MSVYDRWHTKKPRLDEDGLPVERCREHKQYPSAQHGVGERWQVRWRDENVKQCKRNFPKKAGKDPETCADAFDAKVQAELNSGAYIDPAAGNITLEAFAKQWRSSLVCDPASLETIDKHLAHIYDVEAGPRSRRAPGKSLIASWSMRRLSKNPHAIQQWIKSLEAKKLAPGYIKQILGTLSQIFNAAIDNGVVAVNPTRARSIKSPPMPKKRIVPWTIGMVEVAAAEMDVRHKSGAMIYLGVGAGLRESEIFAIAEEDIEFLGASRKIHVRRQVKRIGGRLVFALPKGGKEREVPLSHTLGLRLAAQIELRAPAVVTLPWRAVDGPLHTARLLFVKADRLPWYRQSFAYTWGKVREAAGAPATKENGIHVLRHTAASAWLAGGVDIRTVAEWLGHADPGFTLRTYTHLMPDASERGRRAMDDFLTATGHSLASPSALHVPSGRR